MKDKPKEINQEFIDQVKSYLQKQHFMRLVGFEITQISEGKAAGQLVLKPDHLQQLGMVHGGLTATLADIVCGFAGYTMVPEGHHVVTAELRTSYLRPGRGTKLEAQGTVLKSGNSLVFCESEIWALDNDQRVLIAKASAVLAIILPED